MTAAVDDLVITEPGVYDIPADVYHADPVPGGSLSSSGARDLLPPSCPALFRYHADHDRTPRKVWDIGHAAHKLVLGVGPELVLVDRDRWDTKAVMAEVEEIRDRDAIPLKRPEFEQVHAMADALRAHPVAAAVFNPERGDPEQSLFWIDDSGIWRRARLDWMPHFNTYTGEGQPTQGRGYPGRVIIPDYKTCASANPDALARTMNSFGYHQQAAWYIDAVKAVYPMWQHPDATEPAFVFVCQEKTPPYLVTIVEPDQMALRVGRRLNRDAIEVYAECVRTGVWPPYSLEVELIALPAWVERMHLGDTW
jgi:hypothetical protein